MACGLLTSQFVQPITSDRDLTLHSASIFKAEINYLDLLEKNIKELPKRKWDAHVRGNINTSRHSVLSASMCKIQHKLEKMSRRSGKMDWCGFILLIYII